MVYRQFAHFPLIISFLIFNDIGTMTLVTDMIQCILFYFQILPVAIAKGQIAQPISARLTACKVLGKIATKFEPYM
jgi:serine/threonine-protein phosphatase 4 regulatory subunit 4